MLRTMLHDDCAVLNMCMWRSKCNNVYALMYKMYNVVTSRVNMNQNLVSGRLTHLLIQYIIYTQPGTNSSKYRNNYVLIAKV